MSADTVMKPIVVRFSNLMQAGEYMRVRAPGDIADYPDFRPYYTPREMLEMGVFEGKYLNSCVDEYPADWFVAAKLSEQPDPSVNYFGVKSRRSTTWWNERSLIHEQDPRGWFEWYCRFWMGRRTADDERQMYRQRMMVRHSAQVLLHGVGDVSKRRKQRQTLLQWSWDCFPDCE